MSELPNGWEWATVETIAALTDGPFGSNLKTAHYTESGPRVIRLQNIGDGVFRDDDAYISESHFAHLEKHSVMPGDVLVASLGLDAPRACMVPANLGDAIVKADCIRVRTARGVHPPYLMWMLNSPPMRKQGGAIIKGIGRPRLGLTGLRRLHVPVPPLNEQIRIVAAIEEKFSRLDAAEASLATAALRLSTFREAQLRAALAGEWSMATIGEVAHSLRNGLFVSRPGGTPPGIPIFRISAVRPMALDVTDIRYANVHWADAEPFLTAEGDLLFTRYSGNPEYVGACARVPRMIEPVLHPDKLIRVVVDRDRVEPAFMELACSTGVTRDEIRARRKTTAGQVGIAGGQLRAVRLPVPPLEEQRRIVARTQVQLSALNSLRFAIERAHRRSVSLRRSILDLAFRGELIAQDPSDEASSVLLERIREECAAARSHPRRRRVGT